MSESSLMDISVVVPSYNYEKFLPTALDSILNQTRLPDQIVVTDDGSTDSSPEIIQEYTEDHPEVIDPLLHEKNRGIPANLNSGLAEVTGDIVVFLASDDRMREHKIEREYDLYRSSDAGVVYSNFVNVDESGEVIDRWTDQRPPEGDALFEVLTKQWPKHTLYRSPMIDYSLLKDIGFHDENLPILEDWDLKIRLASQTQHAYCDEVLSEYRTHETNTSGEDNFVMRVRAFHDIISKNRPIVGELPEEERLHATIHQTSLALRFEALALKQQGKTIPALQRYCSYLLNHPEELKNYVIHKRFLKL
jgi:glycosyltransferase involved in cell wall biosynthesis